MSQLANSRKMPARYVHFLSEIEAGAFREIGVKSKLAAALIDLNFICESSRARQKMAVAITPRGKLALERHRRGVDPFLVMTE